MQITANNQVYRLNRDSIQNPKSSRTIICEPSDSLTTNVKTEKSADGTIITIGERSKSTATSAEEMLNTQQYGTLTITAINGGQAMGKRTFDHIVDSGWLHFHFALITNNCHLLTNLLIENTVILLSFQMYKRICRLCNVSKFEKSTMVQQQNCYLIIRLIAMMTMG